MGGQPVTWEVEDDWGVIDEDGKFRPYPKQSLINAGLGEPPFEVERPDGKVIFIVKRPR
jgi:hypothetical protein